MEKLKFLTLQDLNSNPSVIQPIASHYINYATMVHPTLLKAGCNSIFETGGMYSDMFRMMIYIHETI
jgi:hypothetical protein